jgi:hypothetical protein
LDVRRLDTSISTVAWDRPLAFRRNRRSPHDCK